jgi:hypothetical protein
MFQCTNKKAWKDIAAQLGIGPSSSGAYTLKVSPGGLFNLLLWTVAPENFNPRFFICQCESHNHFHILQ